MLRERGELTYRMDRPSAIIIGITFLHPTEPSMPNANTWGEEGKEWQGQTYVDEYSDFVKSNPGKKELRTFENNYDSGTATF
jgi:hypothetical protein